LTTLRKRVEHYRELVSSVTNVNTQRLEQLKGLPFYSDWISFNKTDHVDFNHAIGLPQKDGKEYPLFDYEQLLFDELQSHKHLWIKKATGLGVTEFMLRYMTWLCLKDDTYRNATMPIVCGPNQDIAIKLIKRIKSMFEPLGVLFDTKETVVELNDCTIEAYPSNHLDAYRSLENPKFIFLDEADFFRPSDQQDARDVSERYIAKSNPWIVIVSTPNAPEGLFERIEKEPDSTCLYRRLFLDYTYGLGRIYTEQVSEFWHILDSDIKEEKPVDVIDDTIEINEALMKENNVYPLVYNGNQYYLRKNYGAVEIFQLEDYVEP
ncbi:MAG: hypothetical protein ACREAS_01765, partial [Nitrososphaera sp.]